MGMSVTSSPRLPVYSVADAAALAALTAMREGDLVLQEDTSTWYFYDGVGWELVVQQTGGLQLIEYKTLTGTAKDAEFTGITGYNYLLLVGQLYTDSASADSIGLQFNGDTGNNYAYSYATSTTYANATAQPGIQFCSSGLSSAKATAFNVTISVKAHSSANTHGVTGNSIMTGIASQKLIGGGEWAGSGDITSVKINNSSENGNLIGHAALYGFSSTL